jgi:hypothetical protein
MRSLDRGAGKTGMRWLILKVIDVQPVCRIFYTMPGKYPPFEKRHSRYFLQ